MHSSIDGEKPMADRTADIAAGKVALDSDHFCVFFLVFLFFFYLNLVYIFL